MNAWPLLCEVGRMSRFFFEQGLNSFGMITRRFALCHPRFGSGNGGARLPKSGVCVCVYGGDGTGVSARAHEGARRGLSYSL